MPLFFPAKIPLPDQNNLHLPAVDNIYIELFKYSLRVLGVNNCLVFICNFLGEE